ncbi:MAG TPA: SpoIIE family protein phosphatase [Terriglobia bacterium]|nr:SpoIIE family protein phosphatase [Terriglobia bacterium]
MPQPSPNPKRRRPVAQYAALAGLFVVAVTYQVRIMEYRFPNWFGHRNVAVVPFLVGESSNDLSIDFLRPEAVAAGLHQGDTLLAVNGRTVTGTKVYGEVMAQAQGGDVLTVTVAPKGSAPGSGGRTARLKLRGSSPGVRTLSLPVAVLLWVVLPVFCLLLGFWVATVRPRDPRAWLLLALMLTFSAFSSPFAESWGPGLRVLGIVYNQSLGALLPFWMLLFGIYFPEPFPAKFRWRWWDWCMWLFGVPLVAFAAANAVVALGQVEDYAPVASLARLLTRTDKATTVLAYAAMSTFFVCLWVKSSMTISRDARRRLRLLYCGATVSFAPVFVLTVVARVIHHTQVEEYFPEWVSLTAYFFLFLFPLTLAYVIVVHKAMNVSVAIRQGLQYALAKGGIRVLRAGISVALITAVVEFLQHSRTNPLRLFTVIAFSVVIGIRLRALGERMRAWTDRRFFRDAYNAEQILAELSENVRGIVETRPLLQTISERIAASLHVPHLAVLIDGSGPYRPAYAVGYNSMPEVVFAENAGTVKRLREEREPARVYLDDPNSWVYRAPGVSEEERATLATLKSELLLPLAARDHLLGFISLSQKLSEEPYSGADLRLLKSVAAQAGLALENSRLTSAIAEEIAQRERLNREVEIAREVQERLFPQKLPEVAGLDYYGKCRPALGVGGDYYDFLALPGGRLGIALGDVSGKGIAAALMMASLEASLRAEAMRGTDDLAALIQNVNHLVYDATAENRYATFFYAQYDPTVRQLSYVNAGHNPPMLFRKGDGTRQVERLEAGGTVVGLLPQFPYRQDVVQLEPGDLLVIYTDGVSEAMNPADEEWGEEHLMEAVERTTGLCAADTIERIMSAADEFASGAKQHDDITLVVLRVLDPA